MELLTPWVGGVAAAVAVPLLVLMYFLKLRRRQRQVSSTLLWRRAVRDLQVNAPFQRLRKNLLLLLQLLALLLILAALAGPMLALRAGGGRRYVILIDRSASMNATDEDGSRLTAAKRKAIKFVRTLTEAGMFSVTGKSDQAMVIAFAGRPKVLCNFTSDKRQLLSAIESITPTDGGSKLREAVQVAQAFAQPPGEETNNRSAAERAKLLLFSDGRIADVDAVTVRSGELDFYRVGRSSRNAGIAAMQAKRSFERPQEVNVFASLVNWSDSESACDVQLTVDSTIRSVRPVRIPAASPASGAAPARPGGVSVSFVLTQSGGGVIEVRKLPGDDLRADDAAWAILEPPRNIRLLLVTRGNMVLSRAFSACPLARVDQVNLSQFEQMDPARFVGEGRYDVIVLDCVRPAKLPRGAYLVFGPPPAESAATAAPRGRPQIIVDWQAKHPVLQHVNLENFYATRTYKLSAGREAKVLAEFTDAPAMAAVRKKGSLFLLVGFDVMDTNWPFDAGFVMFCYNAAGFLAREGAPGRRSSLRVGEAIVVQTGAPGREGRVTGPAVKGAKIVSDASGMLRFAGTDRAGVYTLTAAGQPPAKFAVSLTDPGESNIAPLERIVLTGQEVRGRSGDPVRANRELWPLLAIAALALVLLEWFVYGSRVRL